jgi:predicted MPP superfamily phosphohydrolase
MHKKILVISDMHVPYHHQDSIRFLKEIKNEFKPDTIVNIGDLLDFHAISMHEHNPDLFSAGHELKQARIYIKELERYIP